MSFTFNRNSKPLAGVLVAMLAIGATALSAAEPKNPLARPQDNAAAPAAEGSSLTVEQLGEALDSYGKNTTTNNGHTDYSINVPRGKWNLNIIISMSPNGSVIWMTNSLTKMPEAGKVSPEALVNVLKKNTEIGPMFFSIAYGSLRLNYPVPNSNMTPAVLKARIEAMANAVADTESLWSPDMLAGNAAQPAPRNPLAR